MIAFMYHTRKHKHNRIQTAAQSEQQHGNHKSTVPFWSQQPTPTHKPTLNAYHYYTTARCCSPLCATAPQQQQQHTIRSASHIFSNLRQCVCFSISVASSILAVSMIRPGIVQSELHMTTNLPKPQPDQRTAARHLPQWQFHDATKSLSRSIAYFQRPK